MSEHSSLSKVRLVTAIIMFGLASACASGSTTRPDNSAYLENPNVMWEDGAKAVDTGEAILTRGEKRLERGRQQVRDGVAKIRDGSERVEKAKLDYEQAVAGGSDTREQATALRAIGVRWEESIKEIKDGNNLVARGNANIKGGEEDIREGRLLMETGSVLMRNAHRSRLGERLLPLPKS